VGLLVEASVNVTVCEVTGAAGLKLKAAVGALCTGVTCDGDAPLPALHPCMAKAAIAVRTRQVNRR